MAILAKIRIPHLLSTSGIARLALASLLALSGCTAMRVKLGMKVYLDKTPISSIQANLSNSQGIAPGQKLPLVVKLTAPDGKVLVTEGQGQGKVMWKDLEVSASVVTINQKGIASLPGDPRISEGKVAHVTVTVPSHPGIRTDLDIPIRYNHKFISDFSGSSGSSGMDGRAGMDGTSGSMGSIDPNNPSPGGDGSNGSIGSEGDNGGAGGDAPPVQVRVTLKSGSPRLLQLSVSAVGQQKLFLVDPQGGSLTVKADGSPGGSGGRGGRGGRGGSGGIGAPNGRSGSDGLSGHDGRTGWPGRGGGITVTYDPQVKPFLNVIHLSNQGGPPTVFKEEPVAPLW